MKITFAKTSVNKLTDVNYSIQRQYLLTYTVTLVAFLKLVENKSDNDKCCF